MRKLFYSTLTALLCFCTAQVASAQTVNKGAWMIGGDIQFASVKVKDADGSTTILGISPQLGYYIMDNFALGLAVDFTSISFDGDSESSTALAPMARYYVVNPVFLQLQYAFGLDEGSGSAFTPSVGYSWFLNNAVAIEPQLYYRIYNADGDFGDTNTFGLSIGIQAYLGRN